MRHRMLSEVNRRMDITMSWVEGFAISARLDGGVMTVSANREGMLSLANQLKALADAAPGSHLHLDEYNALEEGSMALVIERIP